MGVTFIWMRLQLYHKLKMKLSGLPEKHPTWTGKSDHKFCSWTGRNWVLRLLIFPSALVCMQAYLAFLQVTSFPPGAASPSDRACSPGQLQQPGTWHGRAQLALICSCSGCVPVSLTADDGRIQLSPLPPLLLNTVVRPVSQSGGWL